MSNPLNGGGYKIGNIGHRRLSMLIGAYKWGKGIRYVI